MQNNNNSGLAPKRFALASLATAVALTLQSGVSQAGETIYFDNGATVDWSLTTNYGIGMRMEEQADELTAPRNADDGDRNFNRHSLVTNQVSALGELIVRKDSYGAVLRGSTFYDAVYHRHNDNDSPATVNKAGDFDEFTSRTRYYSGGRSRFLDAYAFNGWSFDNGQRLDVKAGRHVESWGESLFYPGVSGAQSPSDAVKASLPGVEVKEIFLPVGQVSGLWNINSKFSLGAYYQYEWLGTELPPVGSYLSTTDVVGPGREFIAQQVAPGVVIPIRYAGTNEPRDSGQYGVQVRYRPNSDWELSAFHINYHDKNPAGVTVGGTFPALRYTIEYFEDIKLSGLSASTRIGDVQVSGEWSYRDGAPTSVRTATGATALTKAKGQQAQLSMVYLIGDRFWAPQTTLTGEVVRVWVTSVEDVRGAHDFTFNTGAARQSASATAYTLGVTLGYPGLFPGWDMNVPVSFSHVVDGFTPMAGAIAGGAGDRRLSVGATFKRLGNLELSTKYNAFLGEADPLRRKLADRDYLTFSAKYTF
ncbi:DUF1302 domain-containing protein [Pseudomonas sp. R5(2019)]|uniref:DUF1302 domain-containing protein n=1 Tax=Pseudomonas sp. R5(2019) TaxID=2697566 RepID=UPI001412772E|nr:DUF1302 family protein [Pseudomonas sp. R5(2019)]NBA93730.1 DUF1302 family protein [Pseudomonas sp. R5(2019)]